MLVNHVTRFKKLIVLACSCCFCICSWLLVLLLLKFLSQNQMLIIFCLPWQLSETQPAEFAAAGAPLTAHRSHLLLLNVSNVSKWYHMWLYNVHCTMYNGLNWTQLYLQITIGWINDMHSWILRIIIWNLNGPRLSEERLICRSRSDQYKSFLSPLHYFLMG